MQLRVKPSVWITTSGLSPPWTLSTARIRISSSVLWSRARASRRFMPHYTLCLLTYDLVNTIRLRQNVPYYNESALRMFRTTEPSLVPPETQAYTSAEVARIARVSLRQLQWWDERRVVSPDQDNHKRLYQPNQVIEVSVIAELRRKGFSLQNIRRVLRFLEKELRKRLSEVVAPDSEIHLLTDGKSIYLEDAPERIIDLLKDA